MDNVLFTCVAVTCDQAPYDLATARLERDDRTIEFLEVRGPPVLHLFERGRKYRITVEEEL